MTSSGIRLYRLDIVWIVLKPFGHRLEIVWIVWTSSGPSQNRENRWGRFHLFFDVLTAVSPISEAVAQVWKGVAQIWKGVAQIWEAVAQISDAVAGAVFQFPSLAASNGMDIRL